MKNDFDVNLDAKQRLITDLTTYFQQTDLEPTNAFKQFLKLFIEHFPQECIACLNQDDFVHHIALTWNLLNIHEENTSTTDVCEGFVSYHKTARLFLTIITDDHPYLIDTIINFLTKWNIQPEFICHPLIDIHYDKNKKIDKILLQKIHSTKIKSKSNDKQKYIIFLQFKKIFYNQKIQEITKELQLILKHLAWIHHDQQDIKKEFAYANRHFMSTNHDINILEKISTNELDDARDFLQWLAGPYFIILGSRYFNTIPSKNNKNFVCIEEKIGSQKGILREKIYHESDVYLPFACHPSLVPDYTKSQLDKYDPVHITITNQHSHILQPSKINIIDVIHWGNDGKIKGFYQFVGIFTRESYNLSAFEIPLLKTKLQRVFDRFNFDPNWYNGKVLSNIINSIPRHEIYYLTEDQLYHICQDVLQLRHKKGLLLFIRPDSYGNYVTIMIYLTQERFNHPIKDKIAQILATELDGTITSSAVEISDLPFIRIMYVVEFEHPRIVNADIQRLEELIEEASLSWADRLEHYLTQTTNNDNAAIFEKYHDSFPNTYQDQISPQETYEDILHINLLSDKQPIDIILREVSECVSTQIAKYKRKKAPNALKTGIQNTSEFTCISHFEHNTKDIFRKIIRVKIYHLGSTLLLADLLPVLSNFGLKVLSETTFNVQTSEKEIYIHSFDVSIDSTIDWSANLGNLRSAFRLIWDKKIENDELNQLILIAGLSARQIQVFRAYLKYLIQTKLLYSYTYFEKVMCQYPLVSRSLIALFEARFQLNRTEAASEDAIQHDILSALNNVTLLDHDRIIRRLMNAICSTQRTNYYQLDPSGNEKEYLSLKFDCSMLDDLPQPRPLYEVFVYSPRVEGIHLRGGKVSRGGIRWSDRIEDFRTEVLELMKAQNVKNAVIVPLGSKGGFIVKNKSKISDQANLMDEVIYCYKTFIKGILDLTDNALYGGSVPPKQVICYDEEDPYLVVAADRGTATFSDIANSIAKEYDFWLGDAFASGGSTGYDHKKMGITSRGAFESIKHHFRELRKNIETDAFTVAGVGDMSGDVFGNGMLQTKTIKLMAAFDHRHIFIDPNPDPKQSYEERERLFNLPKSSWNDYNRELLSPGGGIYSRTEKMIHLSPEARSFLGLEKKENSPDEIIKAILQAPIDLLFFGGIGTLIKASYESNADVGDIANTDIRITAKMIRAKVIGEGANLAMTQQSRIEYALQGGHLNSDAIDNSAGVDCSDHEVNLKILFSNIRIFLSKQKRAWTLDDRNNMLVSMTDDIAQLVLRNNYEQNQILSVLQSWSREDLSIFQNLIKRLEIDVQLNRTIENLPDDETFDRRRAKGQGMTRPELSILLAYAKIALYNKLVVSDIVIQPYYNKFLIQYFPERIQHTFREDILRHPLRREIIATVLSNLLINRVGPAFVYELSQASLCTIAEVVHAFCITSEILDLEQWWRQINDLDSYMLNDEQIKAYSQISSIFKVSILRLLGTPLPLPKENLHVTIQQLTDEKFLEFMIELIEGSKEQYISQKIFSLSEKGIPELVADRLGILPYLHAIINIAILRPLHLQPIEVQPMEIAAIYFYLESYFGLDVLQEEAFSIETNEEWQRTAKLSLLDDIGQIIMALTLQVFNEGQEENIHGWLESYENTVTSTQSLLTQLKGTTRPDIGMLNCTVRHFRNIPEIKKMLREV